MVVSWTVFCRRARFIALQGRFLEAMVEIKPLSDALKDLRRVASLHNEAVIAGTLEAVTNIQASDEMEKILAWLKYDSVDSFQRISSLLNDRAKGTCLWLLENHAFVDLMEGQRRVLPIQGQGMVLTRSRIVSLTLLPAGCGKSTLLYVMWRIEGNRDHSPSIIVLQHIVICELTAHLADLDISLLRISSIRTALGAGTWIPSCPQCFVNSHSGISIAWPASPKLVSSRYRTVASRTTRSLMPWFACSAIDHKFFSSWMRWTRLSITSMLGSLALSGNFAHARISLS